jgi:hypothetical protein
MNNYQIFDNLCKSYTISEISSYLGLHGGTVKRWEELKSVPPQYYFELCRMAKIEIDYSKFSAKEKDQFFTSKGTAKYCYDKTIEILSSLNISLSDYTIIEPSAGDGSFYHIFPKEQRIGIDIEPKCDGVIQCDFLRWSPQTTQNICIGNPPFGLRGNLALKFINHAAVFSDFVCFILPQLFDSNGKGSCKSRVKGLHLIYSEVVDSNFHYPDGKEVKVNIVFQIWSKYHKNHEENIDLTNIIKLYSLSDGGTPSSTRNKRHLYNCDYYLPSTCFGKEVMKVYDEFESLPHRRGYGIVVQNHKPLIDSIVKTIDWSTVSFESTNGAYNLRFDIIEKSIWNQLPNNLKRSKISIETFMI